MTALGASGLARRDRLWPAILASVALHAVAFGWAAGHRGTPDLDAGQKPLVARLVRLGERRPDHLLPRKEEGAPPPAPAPGPAATAPTAPPPKPTASAKPAATLPAPKPAPAAKADGKAGGDPLARVLSRLQQEKAAEGPRWGDPGGDPEGDAAEAGEGDRYLALAVRALQANYRVPATISERERLHLRATVVLLIEPNGAIRDFKFERRSGDDAFDAALERAIRATRLPPPPPAMKDSVRRIGLGVNFHI